MLSDQMTITGLLEHAAANHGMTTSIVSEGGAEISYARLHDLACSIGASLEAGDFGKLGQRPRFGIVMPNGLDIAVTLLGAAMAGEAVPFNSISTALEFATYFSATKIDALIILGNALGPAVAVAESHDIPLLRLTGDYRIAGLEPAQAAPSPAKPADVALVLMTSGSTGRPKIVPLTHRNVCRSAYEVAKSIELTPDDRCLLMWEQFHIGGLVDLLLAPLLSGGRIIATTGFNAPKFFDLLRKHRPSWYQAVPTTLNELLFHAERNGLVTRPNSLRLIRSVAAALSPALMERVVETFGVPVIRTFGMTEAGPLVTSTPLPPLPQKPGSVGKSCGTQIRIFGADGPITEAGQPGEVGIRGENVFSGYEGDPEANAASFRDGWFLTGDVGFVDADGDLFLSGRIKQMINRGGEKISPQEVDDVLAAHPGVTEAATFAVVHRTLGEDVAAAVVLREPLDMADLRAFVSDRLAPFKVPQRISVLKSLPRNPVGKIDRLALAKMAEVGTDVGFAGARNETEAFLVALWAKELGVLEVGIHQDFAALGGDSLSSLRILMAMEEAFDSAIPEEVFANFTTVAVVSDALRMRGFSLTKKSETGSSTLTAEAADALDRVNVGTFGSEDDRSGVADALEKCGSRSRYRILVDGVTVYATAAELLAVLEQTLAVRVGSRAEPRPTFLQRAALGLRHRRWVRSMQREIRDAPAAMTWSRRMLLPDAFRYSNPAVPASEKTLVVGFAGNLARLMQPTYRLLACLDPTRVDLLLLRDPAKNLFIGGVPGMGTNIASVSAFVGALSATDCYRETIALGTSGGGLAALYAGLNNGWRRSILVSAPSLSRHPDLVDLLNMAAAAHRSSSEVILAHGANQRDVDAARQLRHVVPRARMELQPRYTTHNILNEAYLDGSLATLMRGWLDLSETPERQQVEVSEEMLGRRPCDGSV